MDTFDRSDSDMGGWSSHTSSPRPEFSPDPAAPPQHGRGIIWRLAHQWWRILLLWLVVSAPLAYLIYDLVEPTYQAVSMLEIEPPAPVLFGNGQWRPGELDTQSYLQTQIQIIKSNTVLEAAITDPPVFNLPGIRKSRDPKAELRDDLVVGIVSRGTYLIQVALESKIPSEAAAIVNAVVDAYMNYHRIHHNSADSGLKRSLETELSKLNSEIEAKTAEAKKLGESSDLHAARQRLGAQATETNADPTLQPAVSLVTAEQFARLTDRLIQVDLELIDARARLETARLAREKSRAKQREPQPQPDKQATQRSTPEGPSLVSEERLGELEAVVEEAKRRRLGYTQYIERLKVESQNQQNTLSYKLAEQDLDRLQEMEAQVKERLRQVEFEIGQAEFRVRPMDRAREPQIPSNNRRLGYMAASSAGVLFLILALFLMREIRAGRGPVPLPC